MAVFILALKIERMLLISNFLIFFESFFYLFENHFLKNSSHRHQVQEVTGRRRWPGTPGIPGRRRLTLDRTLFFSLPAKDANEIWVANKLFEISKFKFKFPRARTYEIIGLVFGCIEANFCK